MCLHFSGKAVGCHREAFVTSEQKESRKKKPSELQNTAFVMQADQRSPTLKGKYKIYPCLSQGLGSVEARRFATGQPHLLLTGFSTKVQEIIPLGMGDSPCQPTSRAGPEAAGAKGRNNLPVNFSTGLPKLARRRRVSLRSRSVYEMFLISRWQTEKCNHD